MIERCRYCGGKDLVLEHQDADEEKYRLFWMCMSCLRLNVEKGKR